MALQKGERYRCTDTNCGCEIEVTKGPHPRDSGNQSPCSCCGKGNAARLVSIYRAAAIGRRRAGLCADVHRLSGPGLLVIRLRNC
jgi:hypothetical protein